MGLRDWLSERQGEGVMGEAVSRFFLRLVWVSVEGERGSWDDAEAEAVNRWCVGEVGESVRFWSSGRGEAAPIVGVERGS